MTKFQLNSAKLTLPFLAFFKQVVAEQTQIKSSELDKCLTFSWTESMGAYNPSNSTYGNYPLALWNDCVNQDSNQLFEFNSNGQLVANNYCLTPLPISSSFHSNLDSCDIWTQFPSAATYLFAVECEDFPNNAQTFSYNPTSQTLASNCAHEFFLGSVGDEINGYKAFLTAAAAGDDPNTFPSADVLTGFEIPVSNVLTISMNRIDAVNQVLAEYLTSTADIAAVQNHGCWCSKIAGINSDFAGNAVDAVDQFCKDWSSARRCNNLNGGTCPSALPIPDDYTLQKEDISGLAIYNSTLHGDGLTFSCDTSENLSDDCKRDSCLIDAFYAQAIADHLANDANWSGEVKDSDFCSKLRFNNEGGNNGGSGSETEDNLGGGSSESVDTVSYTCSGEAPNLVIETTYS